MSGAEAAIETRGLGCDYGSVRALDALDLQVSAGAMVGLLGPNGAGKTTALLLLATLLAPTRGTAVLLGMDASRQRSAIRRRLGLVFQESTVDGFLTVRENLTFAARLAGLSGPAVRRSVDQAIERIGLTALAAHPARRLSGGWRRLTDIARATLHQPDLLLLDEPTVGLDPEHRDRMWRILDAERRERGVTILFSTHYLSEAEPSDRVVLLARGKAVAEGSPMSLKDSIGERIAEFEGPGAESVLRMLEAERRVRTVIRGERGYRVGLNGGGEIPAGLTAAGTSGLNRLSIRSATLEDVYYARTLEG